MHQPGIKRGRSRLIIAKQKRAGLDLQHGRTCDAGAFDSSGQLEASATTS